MQAEGESSLGPFIEGTNSVPQGSVALAILLKESSIPLWGVISAQEVEGTQNSVQSIPCSSSQALHSPGLPQLSDPFRTLRMQTLLGMQDGAVLKQEQWTFVEERGQAERPEVGLIFK